MAPTSKICSRCGLELRFNEEAATPFCLNVRENGDHNFNKFITAVTNYTPEAGTLNSVFMQIKLIGILYAV